MRIDRDMLSPSPWDGLMSGDLSDGIASTYGNQPAAAGGSQQ
jgi:hypothetical protein